MKRKIIAVSNRKGGVAKTTTSLNLAAGMVKRGNNVLLIDLDPQASATLVLGAERTKGIAEALESDESISEFVQSTEEGYDFMAATLLLGDLELSLATLEDGEQLLLQKLKDVNYNTIIIDCPPNLGMLTLNALVTATLVIVPVIPTRLSVEGLADMRDTIDKTKKAFNPGIDYRVLIVMYDGRKSVSKDYTDALRGIQDIKMFKTIINVNTDIEKAQNESKSVIAYNALSKGAQNYTQLIREVNYL